MTPPQWGGVDSYFTVVSSDDLMYSIWGCLRPPDVSGATKFFATFGMCAALWWVTDRSGSGRHQILAEDKPALIFPNSTPLLRHRRHRFPLPSDNGLSQRSEGRGFAIPGTVVAIDPN